ncbi:MULTISPECIES: hypothetical protein [Raoultella]|uniref:Uncharacterized protein n=2 Tax=Raoultella TaxID=160674 RepID=A0ABZ2DZE1_RAOOR|nr:hypothetical protein [Raoultella ornithinolytica]MDI0345721.1 hypothetical protein [Raoultella ornithinolytica]MDI0395889.1 hypothetical protein [Raoultella ornithinolytica]MDI0424592.1 hypothetical protein [Raoultella ornithinolytica]MDI0442171.1 hypothetical protein [Raoultella ornithinolytica]MDI0448356.1 hypothetical protein [Raoultella ornithinolytica]
MPLMKLPTWALTAFGTKGKKKQPQLSEENPSMFDFSHLSGKTKTKGESDNGNEPVKQDSDDIQVYRPNQHSRGHNVAVSNEAKNNPVLAVRLLKETKLSSNKIKLQLASSPRALSVFTQKFMEENDPTWEFQDDEEKARTALTFSTQNRDANGYGAAQISAIKALKKMEEPLTEDEIKAMANRATRVLNGQDPMSSENVNARRKADKEYQEEVAQATARRNDRIRATGVSLPGDTRRVNGKIEGPAREAELLKSQIPL